MARKSKPPLHLVTANDANWSDPPRNLNKYGRALWDRVMAQYAVEDAAGIELLLLACEGTDRIWALRQEIEHDGAVIRLRNGAIREHPALKAEVAVMSFVTRTLARLGLDVEPIRATPGRPTLHDQWRQDE